MGEPMLFHLDSQLLLCSSAWTQQNVFASKEDADLTGEEPKPFFHERQVGRQCGLHCVNNLLQARCYEKADLNHFSTEILKQRALVERELGSSLPGAEIIRKIQATMFDYDVHVLEEALQRQGFILKWFDKRQSLETLTLEDDNLLGLIINKRTWNMRFSDRHWLSIRRFGDRFLNLDSKLTEPEHLGGAEDTRIWLRKCFDLDEGCCLLSVMRKAVKTPIVKTQRCARLLGMRRCITAVRKALKVRRPIRNSFKKSWLRTRARSPCQDPKAIR